jgi:hypothetical protein
MRSQVWPPVVWTPVRVFGCRLALLAALLTGQAAGAAEIQIESPSFTFDSDNRVYYYQEAKVRFRDITLEALEVQVFADTSEVRAKGQVRLREQSLFISADRADFNADTGIGTIHNARVYDSKSGYYFIAAQVKRVSNGRYEGDTCELTACPPFVPGWKISAGHINYDVDNFATGTNARLELGDVPVFWFPILAWPTVEKRTSGFLQPSYGQWLSTLDRFNLGARPQVPYFWAIAPDQDVTITPEWIEQRGAAYGLDYRYAFTRNQVGKIKFWGIHEESARNPSQENNILAPGAASEQDRHPTRYTFEWTHNQPVGDAGRLVLNLVNASDGQVWREYDRVENYRPDFSYQASATNQAPWGDLGLTAEHASEFRDESIYANSATFSDGNDRPALLPRLSYFGALRPNDTWPVALQLSSFTAHFITKNELSGQATLARPALVVPLSFGPGLELRTTLARTFVDYDGLYRQNAGVPVPEGSQGYAQSQALVELRADLSRVYRQETGPYLAVKHQISPRLIFDALQDIEQPLADRVVRAQVARELVTFRLDNKWFGQSRNPPVARAPVPQAFSTDPPAQGVPPVLAPPPRVTSPPVGELGALNVIQRFNVLLQDETYAPSGPVIGSRQETTPGEPLLPLIVDGTMQLGGVTLSSELHYHHQLRRISESVISMRGAARQYSVLGISYSQNEFSYRTPENVFRPEGTTFSFDGEVPVADLFSVGFNGTLNLATEAAPLGRRLQKGLLFTDFHPICYRIRLSYEESLELTQQNAVDKYFVNRRLALTFDLGSLFSGTQQRNVATGAGQ